MMTLALARVTDAKNVTKDLNARRIEVEDAMALTLKKNGIILPPSFMHVGDNFKPKHSQEETKKQNAARGKQCGSK